MHPRIYKEDKYSSRKQAVIKLWDDTKKKAAKEKKIPVVVLHETGRPGFWLVIHKDDIDEIIKERALVKSRKDS